MRVEYACWVHECHERPDRVACGFMNHGNTRIGMERARIAVF
jgi:hypothetical protein